MQQGDVQESELLYRAIKRSKPNWLDNDKPTSAMFRDPNGVSVDRDGGREEETVIVSQKEAFGDRLKGVVKVKAGDCFEVGAIVKPAPTAGNEYHANIWLDVDDKKKEMLQAYCIAKAAVVVRIFEDVEWVSN